MNIVIAIHSPGAMGSAIAARLVEHGARVLTSLDGRSGATVERARTAGMEDVSPKTITTANLILSIVPPGEAVALAKGLVKRLSESRHAADRRSGRSGCRSKNVLLGYQQRPYGNWCRDAPGCFPVRKFEKFISGAE
jgi:hypothetical protein